MIVTAATAATTMLTIRHGHTVAATATSAISHSATWPSGPAAARRSAPYRANGPFRAIRRGIVWPDWRTAIGPLTADSSRTNRLFADRTPTSVNLADTMGTTESICMLTGGAQHGLHNMTEVDLEHGGGAGRIVRSAKGGSSSMSQQSTVQLPSANRATMPGRIARKGRSRGRGRIGVLRPVRIGQVALWEIALVAVAATVWPWRIVSIVVAAVAAVTIIVTSVRLSGLCCYQWVGVLFRYRARRRSVPARSTDPLAAVLPGVTLRRQIDRAGNRAGLATSATRCPPWSG